MTPTQAELEAAHCWEAGDHVARKPAMTAFRRATRYHQAQWRESNGHPIGTQPIAPRRGAKARLVGSRLPLDYARDTGANFLTAKARAAARARTSVIEPFQTFDHQGLWADLLSSPALAFNLFGDLASDLARADRAVHAWWPDAPGAVCEIRFAHSPGRWDPAYLGNLRTFDAVFVLDRGDATRGLVAVDVNYHERAKAEEPRPTGLARYQEVGKRSKAFARGALTSLSARNELAVIWLEHLLLHSMLQHPSDGWTWGLYVVVHPNGNTDVADLCARYADHLDDQSTFSSTTLEALLDTAALPARTVTALRNRYVPS